MKLFVYKDELFILVKENGELSCFNMIEEIEEQLGFNKSFELLLNSIDVEEI